MTGSFDLNRFAPAPTTEFTLRNGLTYKVSSDPDVDDVARMLRIENVVRGVDEDGDLGEAIKEGKQLLCELIRQADPDTSLDDFRIGAQDLLVVFSLLLHGESVASAVLKAISPTTLDGAAEEGSGEPGASEQQPDPGESGAEVAPLPSERHSPEQSSNSGALEDGLRATGTD